MYGQEDPSDVETTVLALDIALSVCGGSVGAGVLLLVTLH